MTTRPEGKDFARVVFLLPISALNAVLELCVPPEGWSPCIHHSPSGGLLDRWATTHSRCDYLDRARQRPRRIVQIFPVSSPRSRTILSSATSSSKSPNPTFIGDRRLL